LITQGGLSLIEADLKRLLARGGEIQVLVGTDMATDPDAVEALLALQERHADRMTVRRFASGPSQIFHPKVWTFSPRSVPGVAIVGSSNLTAGGLKCNLEANVLVHSASVVRELEGFFDELFEGGRARQIDKAWLDSYRELWKLQRTARMKLDRIQKKVKAIRTRRAVKTTVPTRIQKHSFAFTGGIYGWPRQSILYPTIKQYGGEVREFGGLNEAECLVHGDTRNDRQTTRKLREARRAGIDIISESDFFRILNNEKRLRKRDRRARPTRR
jgi:HKD family nuclease